MVRPCIILIFSIFFGPSIIAQILNIDRENGQDTIPRKFGASIGVDFASDKQKNDFVELSSTSELDFFLKQNHLIILFGQLDMAFNGENVIENNGYFMARFRDKDTRRIYPDVFAQYQWNGVLGMQSRALGGVNARTKLFEREDIDGYSSARRYFMKMKYGTQN